MKLNGSRYEFATDRINIFSVNPDSSGSMLDYEDDMKAGLKAYKKSFQNFSEANSMAVSVNMFDNEYYPTPFKGIESFDITYEANGGTHLYTAIKQGAENLLDYIDEVTMRNNCIPRATFIILSDGRPEGEYLPRERAVEAIQKLNDAGVTTVFVAFGSAISSKFGEEMGFQATKDVRDLEALTQFMGEELSRSCKEQSKSMRSLGANFFSKAAVKSKSAGYDAKTAQVLEEDDWFGTI